jgi:hypothetical protein
LSKDEKAELVSLTQKGRPGARKIKQANILLLVDSRKPDFVVAELLHTSWLTVLRTRQRYVEGGLDFALNELPRSGRLPKIDDKIETILTTLAQSHPPNGCVRWTLQLLADRLVALTRLESLSYEAVRLVLKNDLKPWQRQKWCIPTVIGARLVWRMENILDLYAEPYQPAFPVICFDEVPSQMVSETKLPLPMRNGKPGRYDYEYRREGTCNLFMFLQPLAGWRHIKISDQRTKQDFAWCMKDLVEIHFPAAERIRLVLDNFNTHSPAAFYEAFSPQQARYLTKKLESHYTPEHSSWLNMAEVEISVLTEQCLDRGLASQAIVASEVGAWESERNAVRATIDWRFTIPNARDKLRKLYPVGEE